MFKHLTSVVKEYVVMTTGHSFEPPGPTVCTPTVFYFFCNKLQIFYIALCNNIFYQVMDFIIRQLLFKLSWAPQNDLADHI